MMLPVKDQLEIIKRGAVEVIPEDELVRKLERSVKTRKPLIIKQGFDPTAPDLHLGHSVSIQKLRQFQQLGHKVVFLIGDYTALIGDPSGQSALRKRMTKAEVLKNARTYQKQVFKILDSKKTKIDFNSRWLSKLNFEQVLILTAKYTVARLLERDDFQNRFRSGRPIAVLEFLYPLMQAYDSVALKADVELGGTDQKFNLLVGREIQKEYGLEPQIVLTMPILVGTDGKEKMSKSLGNYIGISESPNQMFGKLMSIPDHLISSYIELLTDLDPQELTRMQYELGEGLVNPFEWKKRLGREIVAKYHGVKAAEKAQMEFERVFKQRELPEEIPTVTYDGNDSEVWIGHLLVKTGCVSSTSEVRRLIEQGGLYLNDQKVDNVDLKVSLKGEQIVRIGRKKFFRIVGKGRQKQ
jgi:tyrosyl-tRNA synthetase